MKNNILVACSILMVLMMFSCTAKESVGEKNINTFLKELYQVENTDEYQALIEKVEEYYKEQRDDLVEEKVITIDEAGGGEIYKPFISKYEKYCSEDLLQNLITNRHITRYDQQAWEEKCQFLVKKIMLEQNKDGNYYYTLQVEKRLNDGTTQLKSGKGIIRLNEEDLVIFFKIISELKDF